MSVFLMSLRLTLHDFKLWQEACDRIDIEGVRAGSEDKGYGEEDSAAECSGKIDRRQTQLLLSDAGELMTTLRVRLI